jgi:hypothetical protein
VPPSSTSPYRLRADDDQSIYRDGVKLAADTAVAGCARCQACSSLNLVQRAASASLCGPATPDATSAPLLQIGRHPA